MPGWELHKVLQPLVDGAVEFPDQIKVKLITRRCNEAMEADMESFMFSWAVWGSHPKDPEGWEPMNPQLRSYFNEVNDQLLALDCNMESDEEHGAGGKNAEEKESLQKKWKDRCLFRRFTTCNMEFTQCNKGRPETADMSLQRGSHS